MPVISRKDLAAKNKAGNGIRQQQNNDAVKKLADTLKKAADKLDDEAFGVSCNFFGDALSELASNSIPRANQSIIDRSLKNLNGLLESLEYRYQNGPSGYEQLVSVMSEIGSSKEEFDALLGTVNNVLELGLERSILKPVDPAEQEHRRLQQEQERQRRQEQERQRQQELERQRQQELELQRQRELEQQRKLEQERQRQLELERRRREEQERQRQQELERQREAQSRQQRVDEITQRREEFLREDYLGTNYSSKSVKPLKIDPDYQQKLDALSDAQAVAANSNIIKNMRDEVLERTDKILNEDPIARRKREREEAELMAEEEAKNAEPIVQTKTVMISEELRDSFYKRFPESDLLTARDRFGNEIKGTEAILLSLAGEGRKLYINLPADGQRRCTCLEGEDGHLFISKGPVEFGSEPELIRADPEPTIAGSFEKLLNENGIISAIDSEGHVLTSKEDMLKALDKSGSRLMAFGEDMAFAIALENRDQALYASEKADRMEPDPNTVSPDRIPEKTTLLGIDQTDVLYAELPDGTRLETPDAIRERLRDPNESGRMYLYTNKDPESAYLVHHRHGESVGISPYLIHKSQLEKTGDNAIEPMDMGSVEEKRILNWKEADIAYAVDDKGRRYDKPADIKTALYGADKTLQIYTNGEKLPFAVQKKNNRFYISPERVTRFEDQMTALGGQLKEMDSEDFEPVEPKRMDAKAFLGKSWKLGQPEEKEQQFVAFTGIDFAKPQIDFAVGEDGKLYRTEDEIAAELDKSGARTLFIFDKSGEAPYAVQKKDGMFYKSDDRISTRSIMPDSESFEPKKSLHVKDIVSIADKSKVFELKDKTDDLGREQLFYEKNIKALKEVSKPPEELKKPVKPTLGFWGSIAYGLTWFFTFGRGDTEAHRTLPSRLKRYEQDLALYPSKLEEYGKKLAAHKAYLKDGAQKLAEFENKLAETKAKRAQAKKERTEAENAYMNAIRGNDESAVNNYRSRIETRLEGVNDLRINGKITPQNIFAHTWLKEAECKGKKASDPNARRAFCAYVASSKLEEEILVSRVNSEQLSDALEERKLSQLNNGSIVDSMMKDKDLKKLFDDMGDKAIDPGKLKTAYLEKSRQRELEKMNDVKYLEAAKEHMAERFGTKTIDPSDKASFEKTFEAVLRYDMLKKSIKAQSSLPPANNPAMIEKRYEEAKSLESSAYRSNITEKDKFPYRKAFEALSGSEMNLDEMSAALDAKKRELELQAEGPQAH